MLYSRWGLSRYVFELSVCLCVCDLCICAFVGGALLLAFHRLSFCIFSAVICVVNYACYPPVFQHNLEVSFILCCTDDYVNGKSALYLYNQVQRLVVELSYTVGSDCTNIDCISDHCISAWPVVIAISLDCSLVSYYTVFTRLTRNGGTRHLPPPRRCTRQLLSGRGGCARGQTSCGLDAKRQQWVESVSQLWAVNCGSHERGYHSQITV